MKTIKLKLNIEKLNDINYLIKINNDIIKCDDGWFQLEFRHISCKIQFSNIQCFFNNSLFFYTSPIEIQNKIEEIINYINCIRTGCNIQEGKFKLRKYFGCHEGVPEFGNDTEILSYFNYVGYNKQWGEKNNFGYAKLIKFEDIHNENDTLIRIYTIKYTPDDLSFEALLFEILCFQYNSYHLIAKYYNNYLPQHLAFGNKISLEVENFIINEIDQIRFSTYKELLIKLSIFSHSIFMDEIAKVPITNGDIVEYKTEHIKYQD